MTALSLLLASILPAATDSVQVLEFTSTKCPACVLMEPVVKRLIRDGYPIVRIDPSQRMDLTQKYNVGAMPTFIVLVQGKVFNQHTGMIPESDLRKLILAGRNSLSSPKRRSTVSNGTPSAGDRMNDTRSSRTSPAIELVDFSADYCQSCVRMEPIVARLERSGVPIRRVNISDKWQLTRKYKIAVLPTFVMMVNGKEVSRHAGIATEKDLRKLVDNAKPKSKPVVPQIADSDKNPALFPNPMALLGLNRRTDSAKRKEPVVRAKLDQRDENGAVIHRTGPMPASVRIRVRVTGGQQVNLGSGTVIESRPGRSLVLTCAHIVQEIGKSPDIDVHIFSEGSSSPKSYKGRVVAQDIKSDVGLIEVRCPGPLTVVPIAAEDNAPQVGQPVFSYGCGRGSIPTREDMEVVELNRYDGAANIECSTTPEGGRSGGGLFNARGEVIGICSAADKDLNEGIYAGPAAIFAMLNKLELTHLYDASEGRRVAAESLAMNDVPAQRSAPAIDHAPVDLAKIMQGVGDDAEITCIINPKSGGDSRVVVIHKASPQFVDWLEGELDQQPQPAMHTMRSNGADAGNIGTNDSVLKQRQERILERPVLTSDASHSRTWPYTVRRPHTNNRQQLKSIRNMPGTTSPKPYRRSTEASVARSIKP